MQNAQRARRSSVSIIKKVIIGYVVAVFGMAILSNLVGAFAIFRSFHDFENNSYSEITIDSYDDDDYYDEVTNIDIYGDDIYLDQVDDNTYVICEQTDDYEKHLTWDYGADFYYDYDSDCYLWYNTDVSPNLWQYWYEDIAGSNYYGWMECEGDTWYIEISDTEWEEYTGDTSGLWQIQNKFD